MARRVTKLYAKRQPSVGRFNNAEECFTALHFGHRKTPSAGCLGERQIENYQCDADPLRPFRPTLLGESDFTLREGRAK